MPHFFISPHFKGVFFFKKPKHIVNFALPPFRLFPPLFLVFFAPHSYLFILGTTARGDGVASLDERDGVASCVLPITERHGSFFIIPQSKHLVSEQTAAPVATGNKDHAHKDRRPRLLQKWRVLRGGYHHRPSSWFGCLSPAPEPVILVWSRTRHIQRDTLRECCQKADHKRAVV